MRNVFWSIIFLILNLAPLVMAQEHIQNPGIFIPFNQTIPGEVLKTKNESLVAVRASIYGWADNLAVYSKYYFGSGVTVWDNYILTSLHIFGESPALWRGTDQYPTTGVILDGEHFFFAKVAFLDPQADLALLKIETPNERKETFNKKPARIAKTTYILDPTSGQPRVLDEKFFAFSFYTNDARFFYTVSLGPYRAMTNTLDLGYYLPYPVGVVQGAIQPGFSGGPLLSPDGLVMGIASSGSNINTFVVTVETIHSFLKLAATHLGLDAEGKPVVPVPPAPLSPEEK